MGRQSDGAVVVLCTYVYSESGPHMTSQSPQQRCTDTSGSLQLAGSARDRICILTRYAKFKRFRWEGLWDESEEQIRLIPLVREKKRCRSRN